MRDLRSVTASAGVCRRLCTATEAQQTSEQRCVLPAGCADWTSQGLCTPVQQYTAAAEAAARAGTLYTVPAAPPRPKGRIQVSISG